MMSTGFARDQIDGQDRDAAAIGQDCEAISAERPLPPERLGGGEEFVEVEHAQKPGPAERGAVDRVGAGERAGMGRGRLGPLRVPAGLDDDDRLRPRGGPRRRHELSRVGD